MSQPKRGKGRGGTSGGFNRGRNRGPINVVNNPASHAFNQNDEPKSHIGDIYKNPLMIYTITKLLGCQVTVQTCNGIVFDGILKTLSPKGDVTLEMAHKVAKRNAHNKIEDVVQVPSRTNLLDTLVLGLKHIVYVSALNVDLDEVRKDTFTDTAISNRLNGQLGGERQLQKWEDTSVPDESLILDDSNMKNGLDPNEMFARNEKFGVKSTFDHDMLSYTTPVEGSKDLERKAERLAREIEQGSSFRDRADRDSGRTEEELFSAVVRNSTTTERAQPPKPMPKHSPTREENRQEVQADNPGSSSPKPQRIQLNLEREVKLPESGVSKPVSVVPVDQVKAVKEAPVPTPPEQVSPSSVKPLKLAPKVVDEEQSGISILSVKPAKEKTQGSQVHHDLKQFSENFLLQDTRTQESEDQKKKDSAEPVDVKEQPTETPTNEPKNQKESTKPNTEQNPTDSPPKTEEKSTFKWNINAKEFKPAITVSPTFSTKTPPLQSPQPVYPSSPTSVQRVQGFSSAMVRHPHPHMKPRAAFLPGAGRGQFYRTEPVEGPSGPAMSAATAAGSPIIAHPGHFQHFIAMQPSQQFPPGMVQQMTPQGYGMIHPQGGQQHYMAPQTVGMTTSQGVGQGYQDNTVYAPSSIQMAPNSSYHGSPQPSPTATGQFHLQYHLSQLIPQQQGNQPHIPQAMMATPPGQPVFVVPQPQQGGQQHVGMHIPVSGPGNHPMMNQYVTGHPQQQYPPGN